MLTDYDKRKLKWSARVEWVEKMDIPQDQWGYHAVLSLNDYPVRSWKLSGLDMLQVFMSAPVGRVSGAEVDEEGLDIFIAGKFAELFDRSSPAE